MNDHSSSGDKNSNEAVRVTASRRSILLALASAAVRPVLARGAASAGDAAVPQSVGELWDDFDPRKDPLETEIIRQWTEGRAVYRHVRYLIGTFKGRAAWVAAVYGFPQGKAKLPAILHVHDGGQRASLSGVRLMVARGYAARLGVHGYSMGGNYVHAGTPRLGRRSDGDPAPFRFSARCARPGPADKLEADRSVRHLCPISPPATGRAEEGRDHAAGRPPPIEPWSGPTRHRSRGKRRMRSSRK